MRSFRVEDAFKTWHRHRIDSSFFQGLIYSRVNAFKVLLPKGCGAFDDTLQCTLGKFVALLELQ